MLIHLTKLWSVRRQYTDSMPARSVSVTAPRVSRWVIRHYEAQNRARYPRVLSQRPRDSGSIEPSEGP